MKVRHPEPFGKRLYYSKEKIDKICRKALRETECLPGTPQPIEIELFVEKCFNCNLVYRHLDPGVLGCVAFHPDGKVAMIAVSRSLFDGGIVGERRVWATIAHEAGHGLLHGNLFVGEIEEHPLFEGHIDRKRRRILCRKADLKDQSGGYHGKWWEWQANQAIGGLLLPGALVLKCLSPLLGPVDTMQASALPPSILGEAVELVATTFKVNPVVARIRLSDLFAGGEQPTLWEGGSRSGSGQVPGGACPRGDDLLRGKTGPSPYPKGQRTPSR